MDILGGFSFNFFQFYFSRLREFTFFFITWPTLLSFVNTGNSGKCIVKVHVMFLVVIICREIVLFFSFPPEELPP